MTSIFINYRRSDASGHAGRLHDRLCAHYGAERVFIDVDQIAPGEDFERAIDRRIRHADVVLVLIGSGWLQAADADGRPRLQQADDYVRMEIASALRRDKTVIPFLVEGATMPAAHQLPTDLQPLATRQAFTCNDARFHAEVDALIERLDGKPAAPPPAAPAPATSPAGARRPAARWLRRGIAAAVLGLLGLGVVEDLIDEWFDPVPVISLAPTPSGVINPFAPLPNARPLPSGYLGGAASPQQLEDLRRRALLQRQQVEQIQRNYDAVARRLIDQMGR